MARKVSLSQFKSKIRQIESKQRQAINNYNQAVRKYNQKVRQSVNNYNQAVRVHNSRVRANRQRLRSEINKLTQHRTTQFSILKTSVVSLNDTYTYLDQRSEVGSLDSKYNYYLDLSEKEAANSAEVLNSLINPENQYSLGSVSTTIPLDELEKISSDLSSRWQGAVFSLSPNNPDAARHFCTSAREVITQILEVKAPDEEVVQYLPECSYTDLGKPTRRSKIRYLLQRKELLDEDFQNFVEEDIENVVALFRVFNDGTHGSAGTFSLGQLTSIKKRVEDSILFLSKISH